MLSLVISCILSIIIGLILGSIILILFWTVYYMRKRAKIRKLIRETEKYFIY